MAQFLLHTNKIAIIMTYPITYKIEDGRIEVTANREGSHYNFDVLFSDGSSSSFGYIEEEPNKIQLNKPVTDRYQYHAMLTLWQLQIAH